MRQPRCCGVMVAGSDPPERGNADRFCEGLREGTDHGFNLKGGNAMNGAQHRLALPQGTRIGEFEFQSVLGQGGFGITYLGKNHALDRPVAIKEYLPTVFATRERDLSVVPHSSQATENFQWGLDRFIREAQTLAQFQHPNIVPVHHFFEANNTAYIVMEYVEGETLKDFLKRNGVLTESELKKILHPILEGVEEVHRADFLHRDIKPLNIIIRDEDHLPVLIDFGAARLAIGDKSGTTRAVLTPGYAPIEQYWGNTENQGPWTDIYALGAVCYRALTGDDPAEAPDRMQDDPLIPVSDRCGEQASEQFLAAIDHALQVYGSDRPQNVSEWRDELGDWDDWPDELGDAQQRQREQAEKDKFVAEMGREPSPHGVHSEGETDLHIASGLNLPTLTLSLLNNGADGHAKDNDGCTPLHYAALGNAREIAEVLLNHGAYCNAKDNYGCTPLHYAALGNAREIAEVLLNHGAYCNAKDNNGLTPLHYAARENARETAALLRCYGAPPLLDDARRLKTRFRNYYICLVVAIPLSLISVLSVSSWDDIDTIIANVGAGVFGCLVLHKLWSLIPAPEARTTPGKAVGFLFIPWYYLRWNFVAIHGLAKALNAEIGQNSYETKVSTFLSLSFCWLPLAMMLLLVAITVDTEPQQRNEAWVLIIAFHWLFPWLWWLLFALLWQMKNVGMRILEKGQ